jgi:hypothetical protein
MKSIGFYKLSLFVLLVITAYAKCENPQNIILAKDGKAVAVIITADELLPLEQLAVNELKDYLGKITGASFAVYKESVTVPEGSRIYLGRTKAALRAGLSPGKFEDQEWVIRTEGGDLFLTGGIPRGTLYATYHFLEDVAGVRWWTAYEEDVPSKPTFVVGPISKQGKPGFHIRRMSGISQDTLQNGIFAHRLRLINQVTVRPDGTHFAAGGISREPYGLPFPAHTYEYYFPKEDFNAHPDWFALVNGKRVPEQVCLTNPEVWDTALWKLKKTIEMSQTQAIEAELPVPYIYNITENDYTVWCQCDRCKAALAEEGSPSGLQIRMLNYLAKNIKKEFPNVILEGFAYTGNRNVPKLTRPEPNVQIRFCTPSANFVRPITDSSCGNLLELMMNWKKVCSHVAVWTYNASTVFYGMPAPQLSGIARDIKTYYKIGITDIFPQFESDWLEQQGDLKYWMLAKLMEAPTADAETLLREFTDGYYGSAGEAIREYLQVLESAERQNPTYLNAGSGLMDYKYLDLAFFLKADNVLERAAKAVKGNDTLSRRVSHFRLAVDRGMLFLWPMLVREWVQQGHAWSEFPLNRNTIYSRYVKTMGEQTNLRKKMYQWKGWMGIWTKKDSEEEWLKDNIYVPLPMPSQFASLPKEHVYDYPLSEFCCIMQKDGSARFVKDKESISGKAVQITGTGINLPFKFGNIIFEKKNIGGAGYRWYHLGQFGVNSNANVVLTKDLSIFFTRSGRYDVWASMKFSGEGLEQGKNNSVNIDRLIFISPIVYGDLTLPQEWTVFGTFARSDPVLSGNVLRSVPKSVEIGNKKIVGKKVTAKSGCFDFNSKYGSLPPETVGYIFVPFTVRSDSKTTFGFGADWWLQAWVDGKKIVDTTETGNLSYPPTISDFQGTVTLQKGNHVLVVRFISGAASAQVVLGGPVEVKRAIYGSK